VTFADDLRNGGWSTPPLQTPDHVRTYSATGDILSYKRCRRQYGFFGVRRFASSIAVQRYFGTLVHDVLDQINRDVRAGALLPDEPTVEAMVKVAHDRLISTGIRPFNAPQQRQRAVRLIYRFVSLLGRAFYDHVRDTEYRLQSALPTPQKRQFILEGIVDVVAGSVSHDLALPYSTRDDDTEIWDYKSGALPDKRTATGRRELADYEFQMRVYLDLYGRQRKMRPARAVLAFLGELGDDDAWRLGAGDARRFPQLFYVVPTDDPAIARAIDDFGTTVDEIEAELFKPYSQQWAAPAHAVDDATCDACDFRLSCPKYGPAAKQLSAAL
jgi:hypothetical protein